MFVVDYEVKGNVVRFYLGDDPNYEGYEWNNLEYAERNEYHRVYAKYILGYTDVVFPFHYTVLTPVGLWSRNDFKEAYVPAIIAADLRGLPDYITKSYDKMIGLPFVERYYFSEEMIPDHIYAEGEEKCL